MQMKMKYGMMSRFVGHSIIAMVRLDEVQCTRYL